MTKQSTEQQLIVAIRRAKRKVRELQKCLNQPDKKPKPSGGRARGFGEEKVMNFRHSQYITIYIGRQA